MNGNVHKLIFECDACEHAVCRTEIEILWPHKHRDLLPKGPPSSACPLLASGLSNGADWIEVSP